MLTYVVVAVMTLAGVATLIWVTRLVLVPKEIHVKSRTSLGVLWMCDHCGEVVTKRNFAEHGVHCAERPERRGAERFRD